MASAVTGASLLAAAAPANAAPAVTYVTDVNGGQGYTAYPVANGTAAIDTFVDAAGHIGSLRLATPGSSDKVQVFTSASGKVSALSALTYDSYTASGANANLTAALNITAFCDSTASTGFTSFVFEPYYSSAANGKTGPNVATGTWQSWDAYSGGNAIWWTSKFISTTAGGGIVAGPAGAGKVGGPDSFVSFTSLISAFENACPNSSAIAVGFNQGSGNDSLVTHVDALSSTFGTTSQTADFQPATPIDFNQTKVFGSTVAGATATASWSLTSGPAGQPVSNGHLNISVDNATAAELSSCTVSVNGGPANPVTIAYNPMVNNAPYTGAVIYDASNLVIATGTSLAIKVTCQTTAGAKIGNYPVTASFSYCNEDAQAGEAAAVVAEMAVQPCTVGTLLDVLSITAAPVVTTPPAVTPVVTPVVTPSPSASAVLAATGPAQASDGLILGLIALLGGMALVGIGAVRRTGSTRQH
jgi:hypothetical protein